MEARGGPAPVNQGRHKAGSAAHTRSLARMHTCSPAQSPTGFALPLPKPRGGGGRGGFGLKTGGILSVLTRLESKSC